MIVQAIGLSNLVAPATAPAAAGTSGASSFGGILGQTIQNLANVQSKADSQAVSVATGKDVSLVDSVLSMEQTTLSFKMVMQVRDQVLSAYQDVMRTQV